MNPLDMAIFSTGYLVLGAYVESEAVIPNWEVLGIYWADSEEAAITAGFDDHGEKLFTDLAAVDITEIGRYRLKTEPQWRKAGVGLG